MEKKRIIVAGTGASGAPLLVECLKEIRKHPEFESFLIISDGAKLTLKSETKMTYEEICNMADNIIPPEKIGAGPASGSFKSEGMLIVPCSMKTLAGINAGYAENLILRCADVTIKEQRRLVLAVRETPFSPIHLRNMSELSLMPGVMIIPPMLTFYNQPETVEDMTRHIVAKLLNPFGIEMEGYKRWKGI